MKMWTEIDPAKKDKLESQYARRMETFEKYLQQTNCLADKTCQVKPEKNQSVTDNSDNSNMQVTSAHKKKGKNCVYLSLNLICWMCF